jgi:hypothetical protein
VPIKPPKTQPAGEGVIDLHVGDVIGDARSGPLLK